MEGSPSDTRVDLSRHRRAVVEMTTFSAAIPQFPVFLDVELSKVARYRAARPDRLSYTDIVSLAVARQLRRHPGSNASFDGDAIIEHAGVHVGLALDSPRGLIVVVVRDADRLTLGAFRDERLRLSAAAADGRLRSLDISDATFVVSNLGPFGVDSFAAMLVPPAAGILAVGRIVERAWASDGVVRTGPGVTLCLTSDHRVVDGAAAARFLRDLGDSLEREDAVAQLMEVEGK
jgi:pyruvate dehydrogenase E2 component (dihydrolipoyllysine-residue acetyltransferase)